MRVRTYLRRIFSWREARRISASVIMMLSLFAVGTTPASALSNGDFSSGLAGWSSTGPVSVDAGELLLSDAGPSESAAWQVVEVFAPRTRVEFDVLAALSDFTPSDPFGFPDIFAASIQLFDDAAGFASDAGTSLAAVSVVTFDHAGPYDAAATIAPAVRGGDWLHVAIEFDSPHLYLAPVFELIELGLEGGDSAVRIDDVTVTPVPEPGTGLLVGLGLAAAGIARRSA